jgi:hypothetical protein
MVFVRRFRAATGLTLIVGVSALSCSVDEKDRDLRSNSTLLLPMIAERGPDLTGAWRSAVTFTDDTCGTLNLPLAPEGVVKIIHTASALDLRRFTLCGTLISVGSGTSGSGDAVRIVYDQTLVVSDVCSLTLHEVQDGTLDGSQNAVEGEMMLTVSPGSRCGLPAACAISGTFLMARCPPGDCAFQDCSTSGP